MRVADRVSLAWGALREHRLRTGLSMLGVTIGITAVVLLTSIGQGARQFVLSEFSQFGTNMFQVTPGRAETLGIAGANAGTTQKLTLQDAEALERLPGVEVVLPTVLGMGRVEGNGRGRSVYVIGATDAAPDLWKFELRQGRFLSSGDARRGADQVVLGATLAKELFGTLPAVGEWVRIAGARMRVIGVTKPKGRVLSFDMDDLAYVPVATAMRLFDKDGLGEIDITFRNERDAERVVERVRETLVARHGREDFTILTQAQMLEVLGDILGVVTLAIGGLGAVSLIVGAVGILTTMWIAVGERTHEIGLMAALGARRSDLRRTFLVEAAAISLSGGVTGLAVGVGLGALLRAAIPGLPVQTTPTFVLLALTVSVATGLVAGIAPAHRAARMDPVEALRAE